ncbi:hypothetical protein BpHYR1_009572 [Brachionus plicatilis]|uniref:Uncharacterized protein n=1 Tax=Brachionus plicatilis TaxID=10195 RepID=A0A3M7T8P1_BRAPC|nr:hypothetical protein BpHYR1_009572 [Brachionus plicatilis]
MIYIIFKCLIIFSYIIINRTNIIVRKRKIGTKIIERQSKIGMLKPLFDENFEPISYDFEKYAAN